MRALAIELTYETEDDWKVKTEAPSWIMTEILQYFNVSDRMRRSLPCQKQQRGRYGVLTLSEQQ